MISFSLNWKFFLVSEKPSLSTVLRGSNFPYFHAPAHCASENMLEQELADILLSLSREAPLDISKSTNSCLTIEKPEYMGSVTMIEADRIVTVDQATQAQSVEELLR